MPFLSQHGVHKTAEMKRKERDEIRKCECVETYIVQSNLVISNLVISNSPLCLFRTPRYFKLIFGSLDLKRTPIISNSNKVTKLMDKDQSRWCKNAPGSTMNLFITFLLQLFCNVSCLVPLHTAPVVNNSI